MTIGFSSYNAILQSYDIRENKDVDKNWKVPAVVKQLQKAHMDSPAAHLNLEIPNTSLRGIRNVTNNYNDLWTRQRETNPQSPFFQPDRYQLILASRKLYDIDSRVSGIIDTLVGDITYSDPNWVPNLELPEREKTLLMDMVKDFDQMLGISESFDEWLRQLFIDGDLYLELVYRKKKPTELVQLSPMSTLNLVRNSTSHDRFKNANKAFIYSEDYGIDNLSFIMNSPMEEKTKFFASWEVLHARWNRLLTSRYGRPLLSSSFNSAERLIKGEVAMNIRRTSRAAQRFKHSFDTVLPPETFQEYKESMTAHSLLPNESVHDLFLAPGVNVEVLEGDSKVGETNDLQMLTHAIFSSSPVPLPFVAYNDQINRDVMHALMPRYVQKLERISKWAARNILEPLMYRALFSTGLGDSFSIPVGRKLLRAEFGNRSIYDAENAERAIKGVVDGFKEGLITKAAAIQILEYEFPFVDWERARKELNITNKIEVQDPLMNQGVSQNNTPSEPSEPETEMPPEPQAPSESDMNSFVRAMGNVLREVETKSA